MSYKKKILVKMLDIDNLIFNYFSLMIVYAY